MRSQKQIEASRRNGAQSRGPITPRGKSRSSRNAITHGLLAQAVVLDGESKPLFTRLLNSLIAEHQPATSTELGLVEVMAVNRWRQLRFWGMQKARVTHNLSKSNDPSADLTGSTDAAPVTDPATRTALTVGEMDKDSSLISLHRYESRFFREHDRAIHTLSHIRLTRLRLGEPLIPSPVINEPNNYPKNQ